MVCRHMVTSNGIYWRYSLDNGSLVNPSNISYGNSPTSITLHPANSTILYTTIGTFGVPHLYVSINNGNLLILLVHRAFWKT